MLKNNKIKFISLEFKEKPKKLKIKGLKNDVIEENNLRFMFSGDINELLNSVSSLDIVDIKIEEPSLEEIFMHYYN